MNIINAYLIYMSIHNAMALSSLSVYKDSMANTNEFSKIGHSTATVLKSYLDHHDETRKVKCELCPEPHLDLDLDRQEATFAALGHLWATTTNRPTGSLVESKDTR